MILPLAKRRKISLWPIRSQRSELLKGTWTLISAKISALGAYVPSRVLTNSDLEKMDLTLLTPGWSNGPASGGGHCRSGIASSDLARKPLEIGWLCAQIEAASLDASLWPPFS